MLPKPTKIVTTTLSREFYYGTVTPFIGRLNAEGRRASWQSVSLAAMQEFVEEDKRRGGKLAKEYHEPFVARISRSGRDPSGTTQTTRVPAEDYEIFDKFCHDDRPNGWHWTLQWLSAAAIVWYMRKNGVNV